MVLSDYMKQVQRFIRDNDQQFINPQDLIYYVNRARRDLAGRTQCVRRLTPISGSISNIVITNGGQNYSTPAISIGSPDQASGAPPNPTGIQAYATITEEDGVINNISVTAGGDGYLSPSITITDSTGSGVSAAATAVIQNISQTYEGQEVYRFSDIPVQNWPGVDSVFAVHSVSIIYSNYRYSLPMYNFSTYQARIRQYPTQYSYVPTMGAQFGQGENGSLYLYPIANSSYPLELDCFCLPADLKTDLDVEVIPMPWQDAVPYLAAHLCYLELQNLNAAEYYFKKSDEMIARYSRYARPGRITNPYGRY